MDKEIVYTLDAMTNALAEFIKQCGEMAEENWTPQQVLQLEWLFGAVLHNEGYAEYAERQMKNDSERDSR